MHVGQLFTTTVWLYVPQKYTARDASDKCRLCVGYCRVIYSKEEMPLVTDIH